ncbi:PREDICTED: putative disease resistance protein RGA3 [Prunus mume]|uniref:Disease resistance protein RGA3 n=1 Tax=Prunus mume TaxID=102107 RepID=A0ABM1LI73_PRUMU|nr:PREDICTED: putative disease resistance protein RGA3 [Prunus mume]
MVVETLLTFATDVILTKLTDRAFDQISVAWGYEAELGELNESLSILHDFLGDAAEKAQDGGKAVERWVKKLKDIADEADDVFEELNYERLRGEVEPHNGMGKQILNLFSPQNENMAHRIKKINASMEELKKDAAFVGLIAIAKKKDATPQRIREDRETNAFIGKDEIIIGRKDAVSDIVTTLTNSNMNQENLSVMAIAGMPGLGKTTLAKSVYNEGAIDVYFNKKLWVCVSDTFNVNSILAAMLGKVAPTQQALLTDLREELKEKKYLLVLDDVWNEESEKWERLMSCLSKLNSAPGSKIIVTTRSGIVASLTETLPRPKLDLLSTDECWSILKHAACSDGSLEGIGREIAKKCEGLPLMAQMHDLIHDLAERVSETGSMMRDFHEDEDVATPIIERIPEGSSGKLRSLFSNAEALPGNMLPWFKALRVLKLYEAYIEELPSSIEELKWLRYLDISFTNIERLPNSIGKLYNLQTLRATDCDLEEFPKDVQNLINLRHVYCDKETKFPAGVLGRLTSLRKLPYSYEDYKVMGREIVELAALNQLKGKLIICNLEDVRNGDEASKAKLEEKKKVRHFLFEWTKNRSTTNNNEEDVLEGLQPHSELERLEIKYFMGTKFPSWMIKLGNLKQIKLKGCNSCEKIEWMEAPEQVMAFPRLEKLEIEDCPKLRKAPSHLPSLRKLVVYSCLSLQFIPDLHSFTSLRELIFIDCERLESLVSSGPVSVVKLLTIKGCSGLQFIPDLNLFPSLRKLSIESCERLESLVSSGPVSVVELLTIKGCSGLQSIPDLNLFPSLRKLSIESCERLESLVSSGPVSVVKLLTIKGCSGLQSIPDLNLFPSLRKLSIESCERLESLVSSGPVSVVELLTIKGCSGLQSIPDLNLFSSLRELSIESCERLESLVSSGPISIVELLTIKGCSGLQYIPDLNLFPSLCKLSIESCERLESLLSSGPVSVVEFIIRNAPNLERVCLDNLTSISVLEIRNCGKLKYLPTGLLRNYANFKTLELGGLWEELDSFPGFHLEPGLQSIPALSYLTSLRELIIEDCGRLRSLGSSGPQLPASLVELRIRNAPNLESLPSLDNLTSLSVLDIVNCGKLKYLPTGLHCCASLKTLVLGEFWEELDSFPYFHLETGSSQLQTLILTGWPKLKSLPQQIQDFTSLKYLWIECFDGVEALEDWLGDLTSLENLDIWSCKNLKCLPSVEATQRRLTKLQNLEIWQCPLMKERCTKDSGPEWPKISHIPHIYIV